MIRIKNLTVQYSQKIVLNNIDASFESSMIYGIVGLNGAGKSTFFNTLAGLIPKNSGEITLNNTPLNYKDIAFVETTNFFYSYLTGAEYLKIFPSTNTHFNLEKLQSFFKLPLNELIENYSSGMKKKLALLAVLKQQKAVFILDEPFNGLDLETNKIVEIILKTLKSKGKTILISSHILSPLLSICDEIKLLENGCFVKQYQTNQYNEIEEQLFGKLKEQAETAIPGAL